MRKLVTVRQVSEIHPIDGADRIEVAHVDGWKCIVKKGEFAVGDAGVFFEIDSLIPVQDPRFAFLTSGVREYDGVPYARIKTMKLRGVMSQGLLLPVDGFREDIVFSSNDVALKVAVGSLPEEELDEPVDLAESLGVLKYERPETGTNNGLRGSKPAGDFPHFIRKTDQDRVQNVFGRLSKGDQETEFVPTLKLDGSSTTVAYLTDAKFHLEKLPVDGDGGQMFVCSRNLTLNFDENSSWWIGCLNSNLLDAVRQYHLVTGANLAFQGELVGPGIQNSHENHTEYKVYIFSIFDIDTNQYLSYDEVDEVLSSDIFADVPRVPVFDTVKLSDFPSVQEYLDYALAVKSPFCKIPEGVVFHQKLPNGRDPVTFKAISNKYLLKCDV